MHWFRLIQFQPEHPLDQEGWRTCFLLSPGRLRPLEVLDWKGLVLAGLGNTAHIFDEFTPKLDRRALATSLKGSGDRTAG